jgi:Na+/H+ antiporter NhaD/arsenite permease-like protein
VRAFYPVSQRVQINYIFSDNVRTYLLWILKVMYVYCIFYLSCNVKKNKTTAKLSKKNREKRYSNRLLMVSSLKSALMLLSFLIVAQHESCSRKTISWSVIILQMLTQSIQFDCSNNIIFISKIKHKKSLKIPNDQSESVNRRADNTMPK